MVRAMVHSTKHPVQITLSTSTTGATSVSTIVTAVERSLANTSTECEEGCTIKAVWFEMWTIGTSADQFFTAVFAKLPGGTSVINNTDMVNLFAYDNKKNIFYTTQGLTGNDGISAPVQLFKGWIKIPKSKQRFGLGDRLQFALASRGSATITWCGLALFKEYT